MDHHLFQTRLHTGALTIWELGDLLGSHPRLLHTMSSNTSPTSRSRPSSNRPAVWTCTRPTWPPTSTRS